MIRIGIVGAENSHAGAIAKTINVDNKIKSAEVVALWGETDEFAARTAEKGQIPTIVKRPQDMIGMIDGVMIDHRHAKHHLPAAEHFLKARIPMFIDKPFSYRLDKGKDFLARCRKAGVPVTSFSTVPMSRQFQSLKKKVDALGQLQTYVSSGPCDIRSKYGGVFFYAIHQVDAMIELLGVDVATAQAIVYRGKEHAASFQFKSGLIALMRFRESWDGGWQFFAAGPEGMVTGNPQSDPDPYLTGAKTFVKMFRTGQEPVAHDRILAPIRVLEALEKSVRSGQREKVSK
jgi:predicted dehydrogenase